MKITNQEVIAVLFVFAFILLLGGKKSLAQNSGSLFMIPNNFYAQMLNPSFIRDDDATEFALPVFGGFSFQYSGSFKISDLITIDETGNPVIDFEHFYTTGNTNNFVREDIAIPMLFFSKPLRNARISFFYRENMIAYSKFKMNAVEFLLNGNVKPEYQSFSSEEIKLFGEGYREFSFGYARKKNNKIDIGGHFKILFGSAYLETENWSYNIETNPDGNSVTLGSKGTGGMSIPMPIELSEKSRILKVEGDGAVKKYFGSYKNPGIAVDLGITYKKDDSNVFSASLLDLGGIWYRNNTVDLSQNEQLDFPGFDLTNAVRYPESGYVNPFELFLNTKEEIRDVYRPVADTAKNFKGLSPKTVLNYTHKFSDKHWVGVTNQSAFRKNFVWNTLTLTAMQNWANLSVFENINLYGSKSLTLGGGIQYEGKFAQVFAVADNIPAFYHPAANKTFSMTFGICFLLNHEKDEKSSEGKNSGARKSKGKIYPWRPFYREINK